MRRSFASRGTSPKRLTRARCAALLLVLLASLPAAPGSAAAARTPRAGVRKVPAASAKSPSGLAQFLEMYSALYREVRYEAQKAEWAASTDVTPEHVGGRIAGDKALAAFVGSTYVIENAKKFLAGAASLAPLDARQLKKILLGAAESPGTIPDVVAKRVEAEAKQSSILDSFEFCLERDGSRCVKPTTANGIDDILENSRDLSERLRAWNASKEDGAPLKPGLVALQGLRNAVAKEMGYRSFFDLQVADYDMTVDEMMAMLEGFLKDMDPLYREVHCWTKHELAKRYGKPVPRRIPAHWINNRWAQNWVGIVEGVELDPYFKDKTPEWIVRKAEAFYVSMGFPALPESFYTLSDLYPVPEGSDRKKNTHASAWDMDLAGDVRSLQSIQADSQWFSTAHHELGHIYYYLSYDRPGVPIVLREGANRAFHEGIGELIALASRQQPYLANVGILPAGKSLDQQKWLLNEALEETVPFIPWSAGTMSHWERDLYEGNLPPDQFNRRWWDYVAKFQGVDPPEPRGEEFCDAATKTHVNDDPAQYYDYAIATVLKYQLHDKICRDILKQEPHSCNYYGSKPVGDFLRSILEQGATKPWRDVIREATGSELSTKPMVAYFEPLRMQLRKENAGRQCGWD
jgi:peptidyl-dipeptidase A